ncbi:four helix bundle protein [Plebeiibacterium marinum]|uniref:four helix bundle protein n=1 Tax=Plebeiibacterium marinum TaxID=2992111 RepID=UPI00342CD42D
MEFALGSSYELETQLVVIDELKLVGDYSVSFIMNQLNGEQKMINSLISKLK